MHLWWYPVRNYKFIFCLLPSLFISRKLWVSVFFFLISEYFYGLYLPENVLTTFGQTSGYVLHLCCDRWNSIYNGRIMHWTSENFILVSMKQKLGLIRFCIVHGLNHVDECCLKSRQKLIFESMFWKKLTPYFYFRYYILRVLWLT